MSLPSDPAAPRPRLIGADEAPRLTLGGAVARLVAPGSMTEDRFGLFRWDMAPHAGGPGPHVHRTFAESFFVLDGVVRLFDGVGWAEARAGDYLYVPEDGVHAFRNDSPDPASMLILFSPGAPREDYFRELAEMAADGRVLEGDERAAFLARHDQYMV